VKETTIHSGVITRAAGRRRRALILGALPAIAAGVLLTAPAVSASASNTPVRHAPVASSHGAAGQATHAVKAAAPVGQVGRDWTSCPSTYLCFWVNANWGGAMGKLAGPNPTWTVFPQSQCRGGNWNDCASALYNHGSSDQALVYENVGESGPYACIPRGTTEFANLTQWVYSQDGHSMNDSISSNAWTTNPCT
jgi:hypothetical protein